jgi:hypothetical protein
MACLGSWFLIVEHVGYYALHFVFIVTYYLCFAFLCGTMFLSSYFLLLLFRESSAGIYEDDRKSTSGGCFSVLVNSNLSIRTRLLLSYMLELYFIFSLKACFVVVVVFFFFLYI